MFTVYAIFSGRTAPSGNLLYIGQTSDLRQRMRHHRSRSDWLPRQHAVEELAVCESRFRAVMIEEFFIGALNPPHNVRGRTNLTPAAVA